MQHETKIHELVGGAKLLSIHIPNTISFYWSSYIRGGFRYAQQNLYELPHLLEHMAFEGTKTYPNPYDFKAEVEKNGAYYNAHTGQDFVWYDFAGNPEELERIVDLNFSQMFEPIIDAERISQQQKVIEQEWSRRKENDGSRLSYYNWLALKPTEYPDIDERIATVHRATDSNLKRFHDVHYGAANITFVVSGDFSQTRIEQLKTQLNRHLAKVPKGKKHDFVDVPFGKYAGKIVTKQPYKEKQSHFYLSFVTPSRASDETAAALRVLTTMLCGGMGSRLMLKARERGLTYGISAGMNRQSDLTSVGIFSQTELQNLQPLVELASQELADAAAGGFKDYELDRAKGYIVGSIRRSFQTPAQYAGWYDDDFIRERELGSPEDWVAQIEKIDRAKITEAAERYVGADKMLLTMIGKDLEAEKDNYQKLLSSYFS